MKKSLILALSLAAAPVFAGTPVIAPAPAPAPACCPISIEAAAVYGFATGDIRDGGISKDIDVNGADITGIYTINENHSVNLRFGYTFGDECLRRGSVTRYYTDGVLTGTTPAYQSVEIDVHTFSFMPGYRYTHAINDKWAAFIGANIGASNVSVKYCSDYNAVDSASRSKRHGSDWGLAYSAEVGVSYQIDEQWYALAAYSFFGSTAAPDLSNGRTNIPVDNQNYHGLRVGVGYKF